MLVDYDLRWTNNRWVEKPENIALTTGSTGRKSEWLMNSAKKWTLYIEYYDFLESEGEVLVEKDDVTGDIYGFSVEYNDPKLKTRITKLN